MTDRLHTSKLDREILSLATEDWYPIWDVVAISRKMSPALDEPTHHEVARAALTRMVEGELIFLCLFKHIGNKEVRIPNEQGHDILCDVSNWQRDASGWHVCFAATEKGEQTYYALPPLELRD